MGGIYLLFPVLIVIVMSFLAVRAGAIALMMTGMDPKTASFQALSAFTRTGFTTREAESVVNHPQRRRIITWLIILGNAGLVAVIVTATSSVVTSTGYQLPITIVTLIGGTYLVYWLTERRGFIRRWERFVEKRIARSGIVKESVTEDLMHLTEGYGLARAVITKDSPFAGNPLSEVTRKLPERELLVLGIERGNNWIPLPTSREIVAEDDRLVVYGDLTLVKNMLKRG